MYGQGSRCPALRQRRASFPVLQDGVVQQRDVQSVGAALELRRADERAGGRRHRGAQRARRSSCPRSARASRRQGRAQRENHWRWSQRRAVRCRGGPDEIHAQARRALVSVCRQRHTAGPRVGRALPARKPPPNRFWRAGAAKTRRQKQGVNSTQNVIARGSAVPRPAGVAGARPSPGITEPPADASSTTPGSRPGSNAHRSGGPAHPQRHRVRRAAAPCHAPSRAPPGPRLCPAPRANRWRSHRAERAYAAPGFHPGPSAHRGVWRRTHRTSSRAASGSAGARPAGASGA